MLKQFYNLGIIWSNWKSKIYTLNEYTKGLFYNKKIKGHLMMHYYNINNVVPSIGAPILYIQYYWRYWFYSVNNW